jgi:hypothetical protein
MQKNHESQKHEQLVVTINGRDKTGTFSRSKSWQAGLVKVALCCPALAGMSDWVK